MMKYFALLRGINISGKKKVLMAELRDVFESLNFEKVETYIQSGNVVFETSSRDLTEFVLKIENEIEDRFGFKVPVVIRSKNQMKKIVDDFPWEDIYPEKEPTTVLISMLSEKPLKGNVNKLLDAVKDPERLKVQGDKVYLYCPNGYGKSKLNNNFIESQLGAISTTRNWKTITRLLQMLEG